MKDVFAIASFVCAIIFVSTSSVAGTISKLPDINKAFTLLGRGDNYEHLCHFGAVYIFISGGIGKTMTVLVDPKDGKPVTCADYQSFINRAGLRK